jgi:hypothetical protein
MSGRLLGLLLPLALVATTACGGRGGREVTGLPAGAPVWRAPAEPAEGGFAHALVETRSACVLVVLLESDGGLRTELLRREAPAAQAIGLVWRAEHVATRSALEDPAPAEEARAGRTHPERAALTVGFEDRGNVSQLQTLWTRPGLGRTTIEALPPPVLEEEIPFGGEVELVAVLLTDLERGSARIRRGTGGTRLVLPEGARPADRGRLHRLILRVEDVPDRRSKEG